LKIPAKIVTLKGVAAPDSRNSKEVLAMSPLYVAILALVAPPSGGAEVPATPPAGPPAAVSVEKAAPGATAGLSSSDVSGDLTGTAGQASSGTRFQGKVAPRTGPKLREAVRAALSRWARPSDAEADAAAREFLGLYKELQADDQLSRSQREYFVQKVRFRLTRLSDQITRRVAREKRLAKSRRANGTSEPGDQGTGGGTPEDYLPTTGAGNPAFGGGAIGIPDYGPQLVELIQTTIRPDTWDINGGPGSIYYWYPGRALVIRQMGDVHEQVGGVLGQLRRAGQ